MADITTTLWFLLVAAVAGVKGQGEEEFFFNDEMDGFFAQFREDIRLANNSQFPLPNVQAEYSKSILFLNLRGEWNGTSGTVRDMGTIHRTNNATIASSKDYFVFRAEFGFDDLTVGYKYTAKFLGIPLHGDLLLSVDNNSIYVELLVNLTENRCSGNVVTIRNLRFTSLDRITASVTGLSIVNGMANFWLTRALNDVSTSFTTPIENGLRTFFRDNIKEFDFCEYGTIPKNIPFDDRETSDDFNFSGGPPDTINVTSRDINAILN